MSATRPEQLTYLRPEAAAKPASTALVPVVTSAQLLPPPQPFPTPDPTFVTQLIANNQQSAERRRWPRDRAADAFSAYHPHHTRPAGVKTRQMI